MYALSILQPYADAIITGPKRCENRYWYTKFRGPLLIHAGKSRRELDSEDDHSRLVFGAIIGQVQVTDCVTVEQYIAKYGQDPWTCWGPYCIRTATPIAFKNPIPYKGQLGIFEIDAATAALVEKELAHAHRA